MVFGAIYFETLVQINKTLCMHICIEIGFCVPVYVIHDSAENKNINVIFWYQSQDNCELCLA
jgi:hypothetical protein